MKLLFLTIIIALFFATGVDAQVVSGRAENTDNAWVFNPNADSITNTMPVYGKQLAIIPKAFNGFPYGEQDSLRRAREVACTRAENLAKKDMYNKELKYYQFGMPMREYPHQIKRELLRDLYGIEYMMMGCVVEDSLMCYNRAAEQIIQHKYGTDFWQKVEQQVDSAAKATGWKWEY